MSQPGQAEVFHWHQEQKDNCKEGER